MTPPPDDPPRRPRRPLHEAAHKLPPEPVLPTGQEAAPGVPPRSHGASVLRTREETGAAVGVRPWEQVDTAQGEEPLDEAGHEEQDVVLHARRAVLALAALGVVYGDIGTSPLYTEQVTFAYKAARHINPTDVYGVMSLIFWAITVIVSVKYAGFIMRAHNRGDGGIMALAAIVRRRRVPRAAALVTLGVFGAALFFGDGVITPAISVLSAVSGLEVPVPGVRHLVVPISVAILIGLFVIQRRGTSAVGGLFGPVMLLWFVVIGGLGLTEVVTHPGVLQGLSPVWGARFFMRHGIEGFLALGGVVLAVTGAEALYADRGHFGPAPIRMAWFGIVLPAVLLSYLGQAALVLAHPHDAENPFIHLAPSWAQVPLVVLATLATVIASQAVISGSYSVARQAMQIGYLPRLRIVHTSVQEGQIYVPVINWLLGAGVVILVLTFESSTGLANAYGVAVTGTFILNTLLFLAVARAIWRPPRWQLAALGTLFLVVEVSFFIANAAKILEGAWLPLVAGLIISIVMLTWNRGRALVTDMRTEREGELPEFLESLLTREPEVRRVPGTAIFLNPGRQTTPLALRAAIEHTHTLHQKVLIVSVRETSLPTVDDASRFRIERLGPEQFHVRYVRILVGYRERHDVPRLLRLARRELLLERDLDLEHASYFVSRIAIAAAETSQMHRWQQKLFVAMARNAASAVEQFALPPDRTVGIGAQIDV